jgi:hypothetical protein
VKTHNPLHEFTQMSKAYDRIALARKLINDILEAKYVQVWIIYNLLTMKIHLKRWQARWIH